MEEAEVDMEEHAVKRWMDAISLLLVA